MLRLTDGGGFGVCDGCEREIPEHEPCIVNTKWNKRLCADCIRWAATVLEEGGV